MRKRKPRSKKRRPAKGAFRNVTKHWIYVSKRTNRQVSKAHARRYPKSVKRKARYHSKITGKWIKRESVNKNARLQAIQEYLGGALSTRGKGPVFGSQMEFWKFSIAPDTTMDELRAQGNNYQRWYIALYKENPDLLTPKLRRHAYWESMRMELGGSEEQ